MREFSFLSLNTFLGKCVDFSTFDITGTFFHSQLCFVRNNCAFYHSKIWKINTGSAKSIQTEKAKFSYFDNERRQKPDKVELGNK